MKLLRISFFAAQQSFMTTAPLGAPPRQGGIFVCLRPHFHVVRATPRVVMDVRVITRLADRRAVVPACRSDRDHLTGHRCACMAGLNRAWTEAELGSFAADPLCPLMRKSTGRGKEYVKRVLTTRSAVCPPTTAN